MFEVLPAERKRVGKISYRSGVSFNILLNLKASLLYSSFAVSRENKKLGIIQGCRGLLFGGWKRHGVGLDNRLE